MPQGSSIFNYRIYVGYIYIYIYVHSLSNCQVYVGYIYIYICIYIYIMIRNRKKDFGQLPDAYLLKEACMDSSRATVNQGFLCH